MNGTRLIPGDIFDDRYRVEHELGRGGFAEVWLATDLQSHRQVALKVLIPDEGDHYATATRARFEREVKIVAGLRDPHTVTLFAHGECAGRLYLAFDYVPGEDLSEVLRRRGRLAPAEVVHIMRQLLSSLREAHHAGLIHRDLKPENIRIFDDGRDRLTVRLLDFGIARATDDSHPSITKTGELVGTPRYMSPEQLTGQPLTPASDIYSLGMIVFELLAGSQALRGGRLGDQLERLRSGHLFSAPELERVGVLHAVIQKMTARQVDDRFPSAAAVLSALDPPPTPRLAAPDASSRPDAGGTSDPRSHTRTFGIVGLGLAGLALLLFAASFVADEIKRPKTSSSDETAHNVPTALLESETLETLDLSEADLAATAVPDLDPSGHLEEPGIAPRAVALTRGVVAPPSPIPSVGCGPGRTAGDARVPVYEPLGYDPTIPRPLVILLHPGERKPVEFLEDTGFTALADKHRFLVAIPNGQRGLRTWPRGTEFELFPQLDAVRNTRCIDEARIFVVASGSGGRMARNLECEPWVAAIAVNGFLDDPALEDPTACQRPVIQIVATNSRRLPVDGSTNCEGRYKESLVDLAKRWRQRNNCEADHEQTYSFGRSNCRAWTCDQPLVICTAPGGEGWAVNWPTADLACPDPPPADFPRAEKIWEFFQLAVPPVASDER